MALLAGVTCGIVVWTITEYLVHRFVMHGRGGANPWSAEHLDHHARPARTVALRLDRNLWWEVAGAVLVAALAAPAGIAAAGWATGATFAAGTGLAFGVSYAAYTATHHRIHHVAPRGPYSRWIRVHHLQHHFGTPRSNYGVTTGVWDVVARTRQRKPVITVPRRLAPAWMVDETGDLRPEYAAHYRVAGAPRPPTAADLARALADLPPATDDADNAVTTTTADDRPGTGVAQVQD